MTDRNRTYQNGRVSTHSDVQCGSVNRQTSFSGRGNVRIKLPFSGHIANKFRRPTILQLNIEGLTASKMNVLHHLAMQSEALVILLQETHCTDTEKLVLPHYQLAGSSLSRKHGLATFVHERLRYTLLDQSPPTSEIEWLCVDVDGYKIVNVYKPPPTRLRTLDLPVFPHPCLYAGDFNCRHADWGYDDNSPDGECLAGWASINCLALLYNAKDAASFYFGRWNTGTNPDLAFASVGPNSRLPDRRVLEKFPRSQHRPSLITPPRFAMAVPSMPVKRWNFRKANWSHYIALTNKFAKTLLPPDSLDVDAAYQDFCNIIKKAAKKTIPRGYRNNYIPCWDAECESLYKTFLQSPQGDDSSLAATTLLAKLDRKRRDRWSEAVRSIDFSHSSRKAWSILNNLTGRSRHSPRHCPVSADAIASQLVRNGKYEAVDRKSSRLVFQEVSDLWRATTPDAVNISDNFSQREFAAALQHLKPGKAPGPDSICPELILHAGAALKSWLRDFISSCLRRLKIPKIWRRALVVAIPKPGKPVGDPKSYRPISLLCVPYKILERLIYARVEPLIDPLLPKEQAGFRRGKSTVDQVVLLTQNIEDSFEAKKKAGAVFIDLTAAYDTVWHRGLTCKLLRLLPDKHMVKMIMELVRNRSFTLTTGDSKQSRLRRLKNGVPQGSVLAPLLFNIYTYDLPSMISRKFIYADDLALLHSSGNWKDLEGTLSQDMSTLSAYLQTWRLKLSHTKTVTTAFHLNNREAKRELKVYNNSRLLPFCPTPTYLGVKLDRSLTFRHHLVALRKKLSSRVTLLRRLVGSGWGAVAKTLRIATLSLVYATAEYCAPVWCRSTHTRLIDSVLNDALRIVTGCLRPTPTDHLPVLSGIQPAELRRMGATLSLAYRGSLDPDHILHGLLNGSSDTGQVRLRSRRPFVPGARNLLDNLARLGIRASEWTNHKWNAEYCENTSRLRAFVPGTSARPVGMGLPRASWVKLNRLRTGVGRFHSSMHKWGLAPSPNCECGASEQTADHVLTMCPIHRAPHGARGLTVLDDETRCWLNNITASI